MRILLSLSVVLAAMAMFSSTSEAQFNDGYRFGTGVGFGQQFLGRGCCSTPREQQPFFALNPPVYYSGIVRRPYGISPFAAPPGIAPVELSVPQSVTVTNPFFEVEVAPVSNTEKAAPATEANGNKITWRPNPYMETLTFNTN